MSLLTDIAEHLESTPTRITTDDDKEAWWERALELADEARAAGLVTEGDPDDEW